MTEPALINSLLGDLREALVFQRELGLVSIEAPDDVLRPVLKTESQVDRTAVETDNGVASQAARQEIQGMLQLGGAGAGSPKSSSVTSNYQGRELVGLLGEIRDELGPCERCELSRGRTNIVFGVGNPNARLMFVGEGPGRDEDLQGEPFVGKAGQLLTKMIEAMGLRRSDVYIANIVKCRPPRNRDPKPEEVESCEPFLRKQIDAIKPEVIVTLGKYASQTLLRDETSISGMRGGWREYAGIALMPTFHPAYLLRDPSRKKPVWIDLQAVMQRLGLEAPKRS